jgi:hypothetical protein
LFGPRCRVCGDFPVSLRRAARFAIRETPGVRRLETNYSTLVWTADGSQVTKTRPPSDICRRRFRNELRVNRLLREQPPPVPTPMLLDHEAQTRSLTFEAVAGEPLGPKYPAALDPAEIDAILAFADALAPYNPRRRWLRRLDSVRRLKVAHRLGLLTADDSAALITLARRHNKLRFAHGDLTARNVLRHQHGLALIDWEWAGLYPAGYDSAFLWFSLGDLAGGRAHVEVSLETDEQCFLLCALLIQLWHLQLYVPPEFRARHLATSDELVGRLVARQS